MDPIALQEKNSKQKTIYYYTTRNSLDSKMVSLVANFIQTRQRKIARIVSAGEKYKGSRAKSIQIKLELFFVKQTQGPLQIQWEPLTEARRNTQRGRLTSNTTCQTWNFLQVKVCTCRDHLTINAICQRLTVACSDSLTRDVTEAVRLERESNTRRLRTAAINHHSL